MASLPRVAPVRARWFHRHLLSIVLPVLAAGCSRGEKREFLGPPDTTPLDRTIAQVVVVPRLGTVQLGEQLHLAAFGRNSKGDSVGVQVTWAASAGNVSEGGDFVGSSPGLHWVVARSVTQADKADSASVMVVGPNNPITRVVVSPATAGVRIGQSRQFSAQALFQDGSQAQVPIFWTASGGSIDQTGLYTPGDPGDHLVIAVVGAGLADTARVRVSNIPVLTSLELNPGLDTLDQGQSRQYGVVAEWSDGSTDPPVVDYSTTGGVIDDHGLFTADAAPGDYLVLATERGGTVSATGLVTIRADALTGIDVAPSAVSLAPGASRRFVASGRTASGRVVPVQVNWSATGGTIATNGTYVAGAVAGTYRVIATQSGGERADTAVVTISSGAAALTQLVLNPSAVTLAAGETASFTVAGSWSDGSSATPSVVWSATGGTVSPSGEYTAGTVPGSYRVIARHQGGTLADTSTVTVTAARLVSLTLTPATATVASGGTRQFSVAALWSDGSVAVPPLSWQAGGGSVTATGLYTAGPTPGTYRLIVRDQAATRADTSFVTVTSPAPVLQAVEINPGTATLQAGGTQQFFVQGVWTNGGTATPSVTWSATGGSITSSGRYTAGSVAGTWRVIAREPTTGLADTADVVIQPPVPVLTAIVVTPDPVVMQPGSVQSFAVHGVWTNGGSGAPAVSWSATGGTISGSGVYSAGSVAGTYRVIATQIGGTLADTATVTIATAPPVLTGLVVSPESVTVQVGGGRQYTVAGVWTNGGSGAPAVTWSTNGGAITTSGYFTAGSTPGTYRIIATQAGGTLADTAAVFVTSAAPVLTSLQIIPDSVNLQTGMAYEFDVRATWSNGTTTVPALDWSATGGTVSSSGRYVAGTAAGVFRVITRVQGGTLADTAQIRILAPTVTRVILSPASATVPVGGTQQFSTSAIWSDGVSRPVAVTYTATGGNISVGGLYTAGQIAGSFMVIASCSCGKADSSDVTVTVGPSGATLVALSLTPASVTLAPGAQQQFAVSGQWSNGGTTPPQVVYSATGGTISSGGLFTAPASTGLYRVIARHATGTLADTSDVTVQSGSTGGPTPSAWFDEDFGSYTSRQHLLSNPFGWYVATEDVNTSQIDLDLVDGCGTLCGLPPSAPKRSMRYDFPDRTGSPNLCHDYTIGRNVVFPSPVQEVWIEAWTKFSANFKTVVPSCAGTSSAGYKFIFGRVSPSQDRFHVIAGVFGTQLNFHYPDLTSDFAGGPHPSTYFDGQWHRWRMHLKVSAGGGAVGIAILYFDDKHVATFRNVNIPRNSIVGLALGRNMNQGPTQAQSLWWGRVRAWRTDPGWGW